MLQQTNRRILALHNFLSDYRKSHKVFVSLIICITKILCLICSLVELLLTDSCMACKTSQLFLLNNPICSTTLIVMHITHLYSMTTVAWDIIIIILGSSQPMVISSQVQHREGWRVVRQSTVLEQRQPLVEYGIVYKKISELLFGRHLCRRKLFKYITERKIMKCGTF